MPRLTKGCYRIFKYIWTTTVGDPDKEIERVDAGLPRTLKTSCKDPVGTAFEAGAIDGFAGPTTGLLQRVLLGAYAENWSLDIYSVMLVGL